LGLRHPCPSQLGRIRSNKRTSLKRIDSGKSSTKPRKKKGYVRISGVRRESYVVRCHRRRPTSAALRPATPTASYSRTWPPTATERAAHRDTSAKRSAADRCVAASRYHHRDGPSSCWSSSPLVGERKKAYDFAHEKKQNARASPCRRGRTHLLSGPLYSGVRLSCRASRVRLYLVGLGASGNDDSPSAGAACALTLARH